MGYCAVDGRDKYILKDCKANLFPEREHRSPNGSVTSGEKPFLVCDYE